MDKLPNSHEYNKINKNMTGSIKEDDVRYIYRVFTYIYPFLIEKDISDCRNVSIKCVYMSLSFGDLSIFSVRVTCFFSYVWRGN